MRAVSLAVGGEGGTRLLARLHLSLSASTLRRLIRQIAVPPVAPPRVIGVDDFALRRRHRYGTVIADLDEHKIVDLLPDRTATTLANWLRQYPRIEVVSRDRSPEYARGISEGAPQAVQVADRWHVLRNLREVGERLLDAHRAQWQDIVLPDPTDRVPSGRRSRHEQIARQAGHRQRQERYAQVRALHAQGTSQLQIARQLRMGRVTVRRYVTADVFPERAAHRRKPSQLLPFLDYIERRWAEGCTDGVQLWREIQAQGYGGSRRMIAQWVCQHRQEPAPTTPHKHRRPVSDGRMAPNDSTSRRASSRRLVWLLLLDPARLTAAEQSAFPGGDVGWVVALEYQVGLANRERLIVQFLAEHLQAGGGVQLPQITIGHREHATGAGGGVVEGAHDTRLAEQVVVLQEQQIHHQADHLARGEILAGGFVGLLGEAADQLLVDGAHHQIGDRFGMKIDLREALQHPVEQIGPFEADDMFLELELLEGLAGLGAEAVDVTAQAAGDLRGVGQQLGKSSLLELENCCLATRFKTASGVVRPLPFQASSSARTASLVGASTQSRRRSVTKGRITRPYSLGL